MSKLICFLLPSLISVELEEKFLKKKFNQKKYWVKYGVYCLVNNIVSITILTILLHVDYDIETSITLYPGVMVKYAVVAVIVSVVLAFGKIVFDKNIEVLLDEKNN